MSETLNFTKLADAPILEEVPDGAKVYAEVDGKVYRVAGDNLGGSLKVAIFEATQNVSASMNLIETDISVVAAEDGARTPSYSYKCLNLTYAQAKAALEAKIPILCIIFEEYGTGIYQTNGYFTIGLEEENIVLYLYDTVLWHPDGSITGGDE